MILFKTASEHMDRAVGIRNHDIIDYNNSHRNVSILIMNLACLVEMMWAEYQSKLVAII